MRAPISAERDLLTWAEDDRLHHDGETARVDLTEVGCGWLTVTDKAEAARTAGLLDLPGNGTRYRLTRNGHRALTGRAPHPALAAALDIVPNAPLYQVRRAVAAALIVISTQMEDAIEEQEQLDPDFDSAEEINEREIEDETTLTWATWIFNHAKQIEDRG